MRQWSRSHLTFANVVSLAALFVALGGTATAVTYVVSSNSQVGPNTISGHHPPSGKHANLIAGSVGSRDVADNNLTGADIANRSGVDTCPSPLTSKFGAICAGSDGGARTWTGAIAYCRALDLRLPTLSEGSTLDHQYDVPGVSSGQYFWTDEAVSTTQAAAVQGSGGGGWTYADESLTQQTVCVTDPSA
jgi:hypothetical protein